MGVGIPPEGQANIFLPFQRQRHDVAPGVGLGLSVVRRIVTAHGGSIDVESEPTVGSTFRVRIPRTFEQEREQPEPAAPPSGTRGRPPVPAT